MLRKRFELRLGREQLLVEILEWIIGAGQFASYQVETFESRDAGSPVS